MSLIDTLYLVLLHLEGKPLKLDGDVFTEKQLKEWVAYWYSMEIPNAHPL